MPTERVRIFEPGPERETAERARDGPGDGNTHEPAED